MQDPISDMLTRIRNGQMANMKAITLSSSNLKISIAKVLQEEGYISAYQEKSLENNGKELMLDLKYYQGRPVIERIRRISKPGLRIYKQCKQLAPVAGFGIYILSTTKGVMSHLQAKKMGLGGEVICEVA